jgi:tetratricopeptide (TPR) repeat protein
LGGGDVRIDGPFLDGFELPAARPFEDWKDEFRARLAPQVRDCLVRQMDAARRIGDFPTVELHASRLQDLDPLAEEGIRGIMEARAWASDRSSALKAFARYEARLAEELGAKPGPELVRMADLLRDGRRSPGRAAAPGYPPERADRRFEPETLIGREREFSVLFDAWSEARRKSPRIVVVTSDPGVGKTTLVNAFASSCQMDGAVVARAQAYDAERELPFAVLGELVKQLALQRAIGGADPEALSELTRINSEILRAFPGVPKPVEWSPELTPLRIADAFLKAVTAAAADNPVQLVIDDVHAADNASTAILHLVARKLGDTCVLIILTARTSELRVSGAPWEFSSDISIGQMRSLELEVLSSEAAEILVNKLIASTTNGDPPVDRILRASGGNPLAIELLVREWGKRGATSLLGDLEALDTQPVPIIGIPKAIGVVFERQSRRLEPMIRAALDLAAILGRRLTEVSLYTAVELSPGQAAEALSRLRDDGYLREVRGDLEFRNELIRAQAYYAVAVATRHHLHRRIAELLAERHSRDDKAVSLEIAWHHLRGGDVSRAIPFGIEGAEAVLAVGAPHGAEQVLKAIVNQDRQPQNVKRIELLLARALIDQSKGEQAAPIIERLARMQELTLREKAQIAMLRASAEFQVNREPGERYSEVALAALHAAQNTGDPDMISQALFECARAGTEEGIVGLIQAAEEGIGELAQRSDITTIPMAVLTKSYCRFFLGDPNAALQDLWSFQRISSSRVNAAQLAFVHSGIGIASHFLGRFDDSIQAYFSALDLSRRVGDDVRVCLIAANLCTVLMNRGDYQEAIRYGMLSVRYGQASGSNALSVAYTNLMDPYMLLRQEDAALDCLERARKWLGPERRWKIRLTFLVEAASLALMRRNIGLALDLIGQLEALARGREDAVPMPGAYWKMRTFRMAQLGRTDEAYAVASSLAWRWKESIRFHQLDMIAVKAWLERKEQGRLTASTADELNLFGRMKARGRKDLMTLQGFLLPSDQCDLKTCQSEAAAVVSPGSVAG